MTKPYTSMKIGRVEIEKTIKVSCCLFHLLFFFVFLLDSFFFCFMKNGKLVSNNLANRLHTQCILELSVQFFLHV